MSKEAIQAMIQELELLPESDQRLVLTFLAKLRRGRHDSKAPPAGNGSALQRINGLLIFTGQLEQSDTDWVKLIREERDDDLMNAALGGSSH